MRFPVHLSPLSLSLSSTRLEYWNNLHGLDRVSMKSVDPHHTTRNRAADADHEVLVSGNPAMKHGEAQPRTKSIKTCVTESMP